MMKNILLVEDDQDLAVMMSDFISRQGYNLTHKKNGQDAIEFLQTDHNLDVVITDVIMPGLDGIDLLQYMRSEEINIPTIVMSGGGATARRQETLDAVAPFADILLKKPAVLDELLEAINTLSS